MPDVFGEWLRSQGFQPQIVTALLAIVATSGVLVLAVITNFVAKRFILRAVHRFIELSPTRYDDALMQRHVFTRLSHLAPALVIYLIAPLAGGDLPVLTSVMRQGAVIYMILVGTAAFDALLNAALDIYQTFPVSRRVYLKSFVQTLKVVVYCVAGVFVLSQLVSRSPLAFFSGLGAFTAVLLLIFRDAILGLVAGIQLMSNNMVRRGDWIEMPKYGADGDVIDVSLTTVKVQNWNKTVSTIPTYALISDSFKNWRGMSESGGRRIKRAVHIDQHSIRFCDQAMIERFGRFQYMREYIDRKLEEINAHNREHQVDESELVNGRHLTNIGTFRAYLEAYLRHHPQIHQGMTFLVRQLQPTPQGLPIEVYVFSTEQAWAGYEAIQADIFDHILAVVPLFGLRVFQAPAGADLERLQAALPPR